MRSVSLDPTKHSYIDAFFQYHRGRAERLLDLWGQGYHDDALTLCCCYLDGLAGFAYHTSDRTAHNFVKLLREHGAQPQLVQCSPLALVKWLENQDGWRKLTGNQLRSGFGNSLTTLMSEGDFSNSLSSLLDPQDLQRLSKEIWRSSVAYIAYERLRNPFVHELGGPGAVIVVNATVSSEEVSIDFQVLHRALLHAMEHFESLSRTTGRWFGHDFEP
jgi:hypothetical protein